MGSIIVLVMTAVVAQEPVPVPKTGARPTAVEAAAAKLKDAERLLRNGRYAEAEESLTAIEAEARKEPGRLNPALGAALALNKAECQASQGEYAKAIGGLKAAIAGEPKNAELPAQLAEPLSDPRRLGSRRGGDAPGRRSSTPISCWRAGSKARLLELRGELDKAVVAWKWFVDRYNEKRAEIVTSAPGAAPGRSGRRALLPRQRARRGAERLLQRRDQRYLRGRAAGRSQLLAGPVARREALSLGLQRAGRHARAGPRPADQPARARGAGDAGPGRLAGLPPGRGPGQGRACPGHQPALRAGLRAAWPISTSPTSGSTTPRPPR